MGDDKGMLEMPQWYKELILRRRANSSNSKQLSESTECFGSVDFGCSTGHQPNSSCAVTPGSVAFASRRAGTNSAAVLAGKCNRSNTCSSTKMVQERTWAEHKQNSFDMVSESVTNGSDKIDSDSSEELQYGPGIVSRLKNRYLSLTLREANVKTRPTILRKATSLENLLDDDVPNEKANTRIFESSQINGNAKNVPQRYRNITRGSDMKRARSVETISRISDPIINDSRPKSLHEDVFIIEKEGNDKPYNRKADIETESKYTSRINRPKRIQPIMNEKEKPPADVVKQTKKLFETHAVLRTKGPHSTGEVAAKVANYKNILIQTKPPIIKQKPPTEKPRKNIHLPIRLPVRTTTTWSEKKPELISPTIQERKSKIKSPDLTPQIQSPQLQSPQLQSPQLQSPQLQSPIPDVMINEEESDKKPPSSLTETPDLIVHSSPVHKVNEVTPPHSPPPQDFCKIITPEHQRNISKASNSVTFNFNKSQPPTQPLKLEINGSKVVGAHISPLLQTNERRVISPTGGGLSPREIEKNFINKSLDVIKSNSVGISEPKCDVPKLQKRVPKQKKEEQTSVVFNFASRKDVPDYIGNDGRLHTEKIQRPKTGEGGITLLPGASIDESFTDYEEELLSLEGPPSPCDVSFINDNILIDGRSSLRQKTKKSKMRIQFVEAVPQIFEYPSEASMLFEEVESPIATSMGHAVPSLSGSSLANYTPKSGMSDEFFLGVTKTATPEVKSIESTEEIKSKELEEIDQPILFSSGTNSDILF